MVEKTGFEKPGAFLKNNWQLIVLLAIILFGFNLRIYHLDYPSIGYHNWKESRYITPARNFVREGFFHYGFFVPAYDFPKIEADPTGAHSDFFPISSILAAGMFYLFGFELWAARLPGIVLNTAVILIMYLLIKALFKREDLALTAAALTAISPLLVFFSHNVQQINPALFFCMLGMLLFVYWVKSDKGWHLALAALFLAIGISSKYTFIVMGIPLLFIFPYKRVLNIKKYYKVFALAAIILLFVPAFYVYSNYYVAQKYDSTPQGEGSIKPSALFSSSFMAAMKGFLPDNYSWLGFWLAMCGIIIFFMFFRNKAEIGGRFMTGYFVSIIVFIILFAKSLSGHSYHQYPIAPAMIIFISIFIIFISTNVGAFIKNEYVKKTASTMVIIAFIAIIFSPSSAAMNRQFDTQFFGLDVAGDYIKGHKLPGERVIHSSHQAYGLLWNGDIKGTRGIPGTVDGIRYAEDNLNATWLFIYNWDFGIFQDQARWEYISNNYRLAQMGFFSSDNQFKPVYILLRKGGNFNISGLDQEMKNNPVYKKQYELTTGKVEMQYMDFK